MAKLALLIGISNYNYLPPLPATQRDAEELHRVLHDPSIGGFNDFSEPLLNPGFRNSSTPPCSVISQPQQKRFGAFVLLWSWHQR